MSTLGDVIAQLDELVDVVKELPKTRGTSIALTHIETARMWLIAVYTGAQS